MIHEVDTAIRALVRRDAANGADVEVTFDAPTREWAAKRTSPTVDLYLFDIREDTGRRRVEPEPVRDDEGVVVGRRRPPRRYRLSYLVTAWTQRPEDEHRLLSSVLNAFLPHEELPRDLLEGGLAEQGDPVFCAIGLPPPPERSIGEIWSAMGGELKPSLELVLSAPFVLTELQPAGPPVLEQPRFDFEDAEGRSEGIQRVQHRPFSVPGRRPGKDGGHRTGRLEETVTAGKDERGRIITIRTLED
jgi:hypothetical protein